MRNKVKAFLGSRPKLKLILAGITNVFAVGILLAILFTPLGKLGTMAKATEDPNSYGSQWKITRVHYIKVFARDTTRDNGSGERLLGQIVVGASQYQVKFCFGTEAQVQKFQTDFKTQDIDFADCPVGNKTITETWEVADWSTPTTQAGGAVVDDSMFKVVSGDIVSDGQNYPAGPNGPIYDISAGNETDPAACYQKGSVTRSGPYSISFSAQINHTCANANYKTFWSYSELPLGWKVTAVSNN